MIESIIQNNRFDFVNGRPIIYNLLKSKMEFRKEDAENPQNTTDWERFHEK